MVLGRWARSAAAALLATTLTAGAVGAKELTPEEQEEVATFVLGNTLFVLYHELGHGLIHQLDLPVLGREEDAVDHLATLLMLPDEPSPELDRLLLSAADGWAMAAEMGEEDPAWWGEHSLDLQRFYSVVCLMYGSDPEGFRNLADQTGLPPERRESCPQDLARAADAWDRVLEPHRIDPETVAESRITVAYDEPDPQHAELAALLRDAGPQEAIVEILGTSFKLAEPIEIRFTSCGEENAFYEPKTRRVSLCWELVAFYEKLILEDIARR